MISCSWWTTVCLPIPPLCTDYLKNIWNSNRNTTFELFSCKTEKIIFLRWSGWFPIKYAWALRKGRSGMPPNLLDHMNSTNMVKIIKQDSHIYVPYSRPNGWTDWAEIFCGHSWVAWGWYRLKIQKKKISTFFSRATPGPSASFIINSVSLSLYFFCLIFVLHLLFLFFLIYFFNKFSFYFVYLFP